MMILITGNPNTGKSMVVDYLAEKGMTTFKMDDFIHEIYTKGRLGYDLIKNHFGDAYVTKNEVDRDFLGETVLNDEIAMKKLKLLIWPLMRQRIIQLRRQYRNVVVEMGVYMVDPDYFKDLFDFVIEVKRREEYTTKGWKAKFVEQYANNPKFVPDFTINNYWTWQYVQTLVNELFKIIL